MLPEDDQSEADSILETSHKNSSGRFTTRSQEA